MIKIGIIGMGNVTWNVHLPVLLSREERFVSEDMGDYFRVPPDTRTLNYEQYFSKGRDLKSIEEYSSENTDRLSADQLKEILSNLPELQGHI